MSNIDKIHQEIERRIKAYKTKNGFPAGTICAIRIETYEGLLSFIDSLSEEKPSEELEEAAEEYAILDEEGKWKDGGKYKGFIAGAEWQKEQMMKDAMEAKIYGYDDGSFELIASWLDIPNNSIYKDGDKVKIIIVKEDQE